MTKTSDQVKGITTQTGKAKPLSFVVPTCPERGQMSYAQAVEHKKRLVRANQIAEEARKSVMANLDTDINSYIPKADAELHKINESVEEDDQDNLEDQIDSLREELAEKIQERDEMETPTKGIKIAITKLENKIDKLEKQIK